MSQTNAGMRVLKPGPFSTFQDLGRSGRGHQGVARSGAFDKRAHELANRLVGNERTAATIEILFGPTEFAITGNVIVAVCGTDAVISILSPDHGTRSEGVNIAFVTHKGERVTIQSPTVGLRTYLSVRGGFDVVPVLGSRSYDSLGKIGPPPLRRNDDLGVGTLVDNEPRFETVPTRNNDEEVRLSFVLGPRHDWLTPESLASLESRNWTITTASNRTGVRFSGTALNRNPNELPSEAMIPGAIQLPLDGQPIVLGPDCGTTGGFPVIGVLTHDALCRLGQKRPGDTVQLKIIGHSV